MVIKILFLILVFLSPTVAWTQSIVEVSKQVWIDFNPNYYITPHQKFYGDIGVRGELENKGWRRLVLRPSYRTWLGDRFYFSAGIGNFFTLNEIINDRWEIRPFQGLSFKWPNWKTPIDHYIRLEERFDFDLKTWDSKNSVRLRYKLGISYRWAAFQPGRFWQATANTELFFTLFGQQGQFQEQARATLGLDRSFDHEFHFRMEITWQQEQLFFDTSEEVSAIYFRLRFYTNWGNLL